MRAVAGRDLDPRDRTSVEARLVEHHDDVRRLADRARRDRRGREPVERRRVGLQHAARDEIADRRHAGARELGEIILARRTPPTGRSGTRARGPRGPQSTRPRRAAATRRRTRNGSKYQIRISATASSATAIAVLVSRCGKTLIRNENVSASMIMRSTKLTVISSTSCLNCDSRISSDEPGERHRGGDRRAAQQQDPAEIEKAPGEEERQLRHQPAFGRQQDDQRRDVKQPPARQGRRCARDWRATHRTSGYVRAAMAGGMNLHGRARMSPSYPQAAVGVIKL